MPSLARPSLFDILIIGGGPAGLNAALACGRMRMKALIFDSQAYRNEGVTHMHTVASRDHFNPSEFRRIARDQIESRYDSVWFENKTITHAVKKAVGERAYEGFEVKDSEGRTYAGKKLLLATGSIDILPSIPGYKENWPSHIYQCLACDGYEQRDTPAGLLSFDHAMYGHFAQAAINLGVPSLTILSNGPLSTDEGVQSSFRLAKALGATLDERKITKLVNNGPSHTDGVTIEFETGEPVTVGFLVHKPKTVNRAEHLIEQLGVETVEEAMGGHIKLAQPMFNETSVKGVFAAGDTIQMMKQVTIAMADGLRAAAGAGMQISGEDAARILKDVEEKERI